MKKMRGIKYGIIIAFLLCLCAAVFVCGFFALLNKENREQTVTVHAATEITPTIYWGFDSDTGVLTLSASPVGGTNSGEFLGTQSFNYNTLPWKLAGVNESITSVVVADPIAIGSGRYLFAYLPNATSIDVANLDTSNVTSMECMFYGAKSLSTVDVSNFEVLQVTTTKNMFQSSGIKSLNLSNWNCSKSLNTVQMFYFFGLKELSISDSLVNTAYFTDTFIYNAFDGAVAYGADGTKYNSRNPITKGGTYTAYPPHEHNYKLTATLKAATCTADGVAEYTCTVANCGKTKTETIPATGHKPGAASCTEEQTCTVCGEKLADAGAHTPGPAATCTAPQICTVCKTELVAAKGHTEVVDEAVAATCTAEGKTAGSHCSVCGEILLAQTEIAALGHDYSIKVSGTEPTCQHGGSAVMKCSRCGDTTTVNASNPVDHKFTDYVSDGNATCTEDGTKTANCNYGCGTTDTVTDDGSAHGHSFTNYQYNNDATYTQDGTETAECDYGCGETDTRTANGTQLGKVQSQISGFVLNDLEYGEEILPVATASHGVVSFTYSEQLGGTYVATKPKNVGTYYVKASVEEGADYLGAEEIISFDIKPRKITVTIHAGSSELGAAQEPLTAEVTAGSIIAGDSPYSLSTDANINVLGTYKIFGSCTDNNYEITFEPAGYAVYIVSNKVNDPEGGGEIDLPVDINVEFKVTQSETHNDYDLNGLKAGYWAQLWYRNEDGTLGDEFTDKMNCILTLKIPVGIIEAIRGGNEIDRDKIAAGLSVYYVDGDGRLVAVEGFKIAQKEDESWIVKFNYNSKFRAEIVFNAPDVAEESEPEVSGGIPWWVWLLVGLAGAAVVGVIISIIVTAKKKSVGNSDNGEVLKKLGKQDKKIDRLIEITDGGFNDLVDDE